VAVVSSFRNSVHCSVAVPCSVADAIDALILILLWESIIARSNNNASSSKSSSSSSLPPIARVLFDHRSCCGCIKGEGIGGYKIDDDV
jgi:hypothetical protein